MRAVLPFIVLLTKGKNFHPQQTHYFRDDHGKYHKTAGPKYIYFTPNGLGGYNQHAKKPDEERVITLVTRRKTCQDCGVVRQTANIKEHWERHLINRYACCEYIGKAFAVSCLYSTLLLSNSPTTLLNVMFVSPVTSAFTGQYRVTGRPHGNAAITSRQAYRRIQMDTRTRVLAQSLADKPKNAYTDEVNKDGPIEYPGIRTLYNDRAKYKRAKAMTKPGAAKSRHLGDQFAAMDRAVADSSSCVQLKVTAKGMPPGIVLFTDSLKQDIQRCLDQSDYNEFVLRKLSSRNSFMSL